MPRKRGSNAISQNYPRVGEETFLLLPLFSSSLGKVQRVGCKILGEQCFQCEHPEGTLSLRLTRKYSESDKISGDRNPDIRD